MKTWLMPTVIAVALSAAGCGPEGPSKTPQQESADRVARVTKRLPSDATKVRDVGNGCYLFSWRGNEYLAAFSRTHGGENNQHVMSVTRAD